MQAVTHVERRLVVQQPSRAARPDDVSRQGAILVANLQPLLRIEAADEQAPPIRARNPQNKKAGSPKASPSVERISEEIKLQLRSGSLLGADTKIDALKNNLPKNIFAQGKAANKPAGSALTSGAICLGSCRITAGLYL